MPSIDGKGRCERNRCKPISRAISSEIPACQPRAESADDGLEGRDLICSSTRRSPFMKQDGRNGCAIKKPYPRGGRASFSSPSGALPKTKPVGHATVTESIHATYSHDNRHVFTSAVLTSRRKSEQCCFSAIAIT